MVLLEELLVLTLGLGEFVFGALEVRGHLAEDGHGDGGDVGRRGRAGGSRRSGVAHGLWLKHFEWGQGWLAELGDRFGPIRCPRIALINQVERKESLG